MLGALVGALVAAGLVFLVDDDGSSGATTVVTADGQDSVDLSSVDSRLDALEDLGDELQDGQVAAGAADGTAAPSQSAAELRSLLADVEPAVVLVEATSSSGGFLTGGGTGTGFIISADGDIVTNAHVVEGGNDWTVTLATGEKLEARLLGEDPTRDLAVLHVDTETELPVVEIGASAELQVGDPVVAIGHALALEGAPTVTTGIVSALDREVQTEAATMLTEVIQTDAAINPGNSGGPLLNVHGEVVGINTAIAGDAEGIGFSISIDHAMPVIQSLVEGVVPTRPLLGVNVGSVSELDDAARQQLGVEATEGAFVSDVVQGEAADQSGLEAGDVVVEFDGEQIETGDELVAAVRAATPGETVEVVVDRQGEEVTFQVELGEAVGAGG